MEKGEKERERGREKQKKRMNFDWMRTDAN